MPRLAEPIEPLRVDSVDPWWRNTVQTGSRSCMWEAAESLLLPIKD